MLARLVASGARVVCLRGVRLLPDASGDGPDMSGPYLPPLGRWLVFVVSGLLPDAIAGLKALAYTNSANRRWCRANTVNPVTATTSDTTASTPTSVALGHCRSTTMPW